MLLLAVEVLAVQKKAKMEPFELNDSENFSNKKARSLILQNGLKSLA